MESSGPIHGFHNLLEIGAVDCDNFANKFQVYLIPIFSNWTESARAVNKPDQFYINNGVIIHDAMEKFKSWLSQFHRPVFVGFNAPFDYGWINYEFQKCFGDNPFGINALDIKAYAMGKLNLEDWSETTKKKLRSHHIISKYKHTHSALDDALEQADIFNILRKI